MSAQQYVTAAENIGWLISYDPVDNAYAASARGVHIGEWQAGAAPPGAVYQWRELGKIKPQPGMWLNAMHSEVFGLGIECRVVTLMEPARAIKTKREQVADAMNEAARRVTLRRGSLRLAVVLTEAAAHLDDDAAGDLWRLFR